MENKDEEEEHFYVQYHSDNSFSVHLENTALEPLKKNAPFMGVTQVIMNPEKPNQLILNAGQSQSKLDYSIGTDGQISFYDLDGQPLEYKVAKQEDIISGEVKTQSDVVKSPMPGTVVKIFVQEGQTVHEGDPLISIESMKMEFLIKATHTAKVAAIQTNESLFVQMGQVMIKYEATEE